MPVLAVADRKQSEEIYRESHAVWGSGLSPRDFRDLWEDVNRTAWARSHARLLVWHDDHRCVLSSMKLYRPLFRLGADLSRSSVFSAIFTPSAKRHRGHATDMMRAVLEREARGGSRFALLFSDIGASYYSGLGFRRLHAHEQRGPLRPNFRVPAGWQLRTMTASDTAAVRQAHADSCLRRPFCVIRDEDHWEFLWVRSRSFFSRLNDPEIVERRQVALHNGSFAGYLVTVEGKGEWSVREVGARGGDSRAMGAIVKAGAAQALRRRQRRFHGWLSREVVEQLSELRFVSQGRRQAIPMIRSLRSSVDLSSLESADAAYIPFQDQF